MHYLLGALAGGFLFFNSQASPNKVEGRIETALRQQYPGAQVDVEIKGKRGVNVLKGRFRELRLSMSGFSTMPVRTVAATGQDGVQVQAAAQAQPAARMQIGIAPANSKGKKGRVGRAIVQLRDFDFNGIKVELAELEAGDVVYDLEASKKGQLQIVSVGPGRARLVVPAASLQGLVQANVQDIKNARLSVQDGQVRLTGTRATPILGDLPFTLTARPEVRNNSEIWLADAIVTINGQALPDALNKTIVGPMNPIFTFDSSKLPFRVSLTTIVARNNKFELMGDVSFLPAGATAIAKPQVTTPPTTTPQLMEPMAPQLAPQPDAPMNTPMNAPAMN